MMDLGNSWTSLLADETSKPYFQQLWKFVKEEYTSEAVYPASDDLFNALRYTDYDDVKVVILGQDPYHGPGQAHGLSFSVQPGVTLPPSLRNIFKELKADLGCEIPDNGYLKKWADQGVLLLNTVLTVREGQANSHSRKGWETFTDKVITLLNDREKPVIFILWGKPAQSKRKLIDENKHKIITSVHPSPLSASRGFFGSQPFSKVNERLREVGDEEIDWQIENVKEQK